jgi:hypothetical protein
MNPRELLLIAKCGRDVVLVLLVDLLLGIGHLLASDARSIREASVMKSVSDAVQPPRATCGVTSSASTSDAPNEGVVVIHGIFDAAGEKLLKLEPVRRYAYQSRTNPDQREGRFAVRVTFVSGDVTTVPFDALVADDAGRTARGFFEVIIPVSDGIASIRITDASGGKTFAVVEGRQILQ